MERIRIALTKGRIESAARDLFAASGMDMSALDNKGRKLIIPVGDIDFVLAKAPDVVTYVQRGVADMGVVGKDTIMELGGSYYEVLDLGFGACSFALAAPEGCDPFSGWRTRVIASKYPAVTRAYFEGRGMDVDIVKIEGSVELAPLLGLADAIVDIVETGATLRANGLRVIEEIAPVSARLIVNTTGMKLKKERIEAIIYALEGAMKQRAPERT